MTILICLTVNVVSGQCVGSSLLYYVNTDSLLQAQMVSAFGLKANQKPIVLADVETRPFGTGASTFASDLKKDGRSQSWIDSISTNALTKSLRLDSIKFCENSLIVNDTTYSKNYNNLVMFSGPKVNNTVVCEIWNCSGPYHGYSTMSSNKFIRVLFVLDTEGHIQKVYYKCITSTSSKSTWWED